MAVYFIHDAPADLIKIGHSADPWSRLRNMQTGSAAQLEMVAIIDGGAATEAAMHSMFADYRARGEWFRRGPDLALFLGGLPKAKKPPRRSKTAEFWNGHTPTAISAATGVSGCYLSQIQGGSRRPTAAIAIKLQRATGVSAIRLVFGELADEAA